MKRTFFPIVAFAFSICAVVYGQDPSPTPSPSPSLSDASAAPSPTPAVADPNATEIPPPPAAINPVVPGLVQPQITTITIYRKVAKIGILEADGGAEITLPSVPTPVTRSVSWQSGHLDVIDVANDESVTTTSLDISPLTNLYQPGNPLKKGYINNQLQGDTDDGSDWIAPDLMPREKPLTVTTDQSAGISVSLGSVFVDDANRIFFTPPQGYVIFPIPSDVFEINAVSHLSKDGIIIAEWIKLGEDNYHVVQIDTSSLEATMDFMPDDTLNVQKMITWIDGSTFLGRFTGHAFDEYTVVGISQNAVINRVSSASGNIFKVQNGAVTTHVISQP